MILYNAPISPSPRRARMFIAEKGIDIETREVDLKGGEQLTEEFLAINPRATVPVLVTDSGLSLVENIAIAAYLEEMFPEPPLMGEGAEEKASILMWNSICEMQGFTAAAEALRNSEKYKPGRAITGPVNFDQIPELAVRGAQRVNIFHNLLEERLAESQYLASDRFTLADITGFIVCEFTRLINMPVPDSCPATRAWYEGILARPSASV